MGSILKIVPVDEFDLPYFAAAVKNVEQFELDGEVIPSNEAIATDRKAIAALAQALAKLTPAQQRASRSATHAELRKAVKTAAQVRGFKVGGDGRGNSWQMSLAKAGDRPGVLASSLIINASVRANDGDEYESFYCTGTEDAFLAVAAELSNLAGPQVTFAAEDYSWAGVTQLFVDGASPAVKKTSTKKTSTKKTSTKKTSTKKASTKKASTKKLATKKPATKVANKRARR